MHRNGFHLPATLALMVTLALHPLHAHDMGKEMPTEAPALAGDSLPALVAQALADNPGIKAAEYQVKSLHSSPSHRWYLEPPQVGVEFYQAPIKSFPNPVKNQMEIDYSIQQGFPFPGKISSRIKAEHKHALMSEADLDALKRKVAREVKTTYYELYLLDRRIEINRENQELLGRLLEIARRQYEVGMGRQADILRAQTEWTMLRTDSIGLSESRRSMEGMLNALLNRSVDRSIHIADSLSPAQTDWTLNQLRPIVEARHPELRSMQAGIQMRKAESVVARREYWPDFMIGGSYKDMLEMPEGTHGGELQDYWSVMASMNVPIALWSLPKYKAGVKQSEANVSQAEAEYANMRNMVFAKAQAALIKAKSSQELARISRTILVRQAEQTLESTVAGYQAGKTEFMTLLDAYRARLMAKENSEMAVMRLLSSQAELEEAVGLSLEEIRKQIDEGAEK